MPWQTTQLLPMPWQTTQLPPEMLPTAPSTEAPGVRPGSCSEGRRKQVLLPKLPSEMRPMEPLLRPTQEQGLGDSPPASSASSVPPAASGTRGGGRGCHRRCQVVDELADAAAARDEALEAAVIARSGLQRGRGTKHVRTTGEARDRNAGRNRRTEIAVAAAVPVVGADGKTAWTRCAPRPPPPLSRRGASGRGW